MQTFKWSFEKLKNPLRIFDFSRFRKCWIYLKVVDEKKFSKWQKNKSLSVVAWNDFSHTFLKTNLLWSSWEKGKKPNRSLGGQTTTKTNRFWLELMPWKCPRNFSSNWGPLKTIFWLKIFKKLRECRKLVNYIKYRIVAKALKDWLHIIVLSCENHWRPILHSSHYREWSTHVR